MAKKQTGPKNLISFRVETEVFKAFHIALKRNSLKLLPAFEPWVEAVIVADADKSPMPIPVPSELLTTLQDLTRILGNILRTPKKGDSTIHNYPIKESERKELLALVDRVARIISRDIGGTGVGAGSRETGEVQTGQAGGGTIEAAERAFEALRTQTGRDRRTARPGEPNRKSKA